MVSSLSGVPSRCTKRSPGRPPVVDSGIKFDRSIIEISAMNPTLERWKATGASSWLLVQREEGRRKVRPSLRLTPVQET
jgi:hypothetical protein